MILVLNGDMTRRYRERSGQINRPIDPVIYRSALCATYLLDLEKRCTTADVQSEHDTKRIILSRIMNQRNKEPLHYFCIANVLSHFAGSNLFISLFVFLYCPYLINSFFRSLCLLNLDLW
jgi:hypothetical protein